VLIRTRRRRGRLQQRRFGATALIPFVIFLALVISITGCARSRRTSLEQKYAAARLQFQQGFTNEPLEVTDLGFRDSVGYPDLNWKFRILKSELTIRKRQFAQALELLQPDPPSNAPREILFRRRLVQAFSLCLLNSFGQSEERFGQAEALGSDANTSAELAFIRGRCEMSRRNWNTAERYLRPLAEPGANLDPFLKAYALANLGWSSRQDLRYEEAIDWYKQCLTAVRSLRAPFLEQQALGNLGFLYVELRDFPNAQKNSEEAEKIASQWKILSDEQKWLVDIGHAQQAQGQSGAAEESYKRALAIATKLEDTDIIAKCLHNLTLLKLEQGQTEQAEKYHRDASSLGLKSDNLKFWRLDQSAISAAHGDYAKAAFELRDLLQQLESEDQQSGKVRYRLKWVIQARLAHDCAAQGDAGEAEQWFQRSLVTVEEATKKMKREEFRTAIRDNMPVFDGYVSFLIAQNQREKALQVGQLGRARTLMQSVEGPRRPENTKAWLAGVQNYLRRNNSVLLSYFATEKECYLWTIRGRQLRLSALGISGPNLDSLIDSYQQEIQQHLPLSASPAAKKLFHILVEPATDLMPRGTHVIVVADSKIYSINFETLIASHGGDHYWIEDVDIQNTNSIDLLIAPGQKHSATRGLLLIGAPAQANPQYVELPHALKEMESVRRHFPPDAVTAISGKSATPGSYMNSSPGSYRFIHLATHGTPNAVEPLESAIILSADDGGRFKLLARDIIDSKVHLNADLVTISACAGIGTRIQSLEGLLGLEWAFMRAGAHQVIAALWDVDDAVTPGLMDDFYGELKKGRSPADALRHAKLAMLHAGGFHATPYYWAALQLYTRS
jgi:CHAT domain-containing protein